MLTIQLFMDHNNIFNKHYFFRVLSSLTCALFLGELVFYIEDELFDIFSNTIQFYMQGSGINKTDLACELIP